MFWILIFHYHFKGYGTIGWIKVIQQTDDEEGQIGRIPKKDSGKCKTLSVEAKEGKINETDGERISLGDAKTKC